MDQGLRAIVESFDSELPITEAWTPPSEWYTSPELLSLEARSVFRNNWVAVGRAEAVSEPGHFISGTLLGDPYIIVRAKDGALHAFDNVCRHHATTLVRGSGYLERFQCPYHGWTYSLDGALIGAPRMGGVAGFDKSTMGLRRRHAATWGPLLFIFMGASPPDLEAQMGSLEGLVPLERLQGLSWAGGEDYQVESNWKVYVDNYLDGGYHVPVLHKGLSADLNMSSYETHLLERASVQSVGGDKKSARIAEGADYVWIYPNVMVNRYGPVLDLNIVIPERVDRTRVRFEYWFEEIEGAAAQRFMSESRAKSRQIQDEDAMICASVQRGLGSSGYDKGRYAPAVEAAEHHFHQLLSVDYMSALAE